MFIFARTMKNFNYLVIHDYYIDVDGNVYNWENLRWYVIGIRMDNL